MVSSRMVQWSVSCRRRLTAWGGWGAVLRDQELANFLMGQLATGAIRSRAVREVEAAAAAAAEAAEAVSGWLVACIGLPCVMGRCA